MSISATICNMEMVQITDSIGLKDDSEFVAIENQAKEFAVRGNVCCIKWTRDTDGQMAYWGPQGAMFKPYWYGM